MVAATAQDIAEGAVVTAAGVAAGDPSEAAGAVRNITGELLSEKKSSDLRQIDMCSCVVAVAAAAQDTAEGAVVTAAGVAADELAVDAALI